jgi:hypothetical protein
MARGKTIYLRSESGRVEDFDQFRKRLKRLGNPENLRFKELRQLLKQEAKPLVEQARQEAYNDVNAKGRYKVRSGQTSKRSAQGSFMNLYNSIGVFPNKGNVKAYVVVGLRSKRKRGAFYAPWQLMGRKDNRFPAKRFIDKAVDNTDVPQKAAQKITNFVQKRIKAYLR